MNAQDFIEQSGTWITKLDNIPIEHIKSLMEDYAKDAIHETVKFCNNCYDEHQGEVVNAEESNRFTAEYLSNKPSVKSETTK